MSKNDFIQVVQCFVGAIVWNVEPHDREHVVLQNSPSWITRENTTRALYDNRSSTRSANST